jgi:uncharacterized membrane protein (DUF485 family)
MTRQTISIADRLAAIVAGLAAFFASGAIVLGVTYVVLVYLIPQQNDWKILRLNVEGGVGFMISLVVGSVVGGYVIVRVDKHAPVFHSAVVIALYFALHWGYVLWGPRTTWDTFFGPFLLPDLVCVPFFMLGAKMGSRKP